MLHIVWEFRIKKSKRKQFELHYSTNGSWAKLFRKSPEYVETILVRDREQNDRYLLTDIWKDWKAFRQFKKNYRKEYESLDKECEEFTVQEKLIGFFVLAGETPAVPNAGGTPAVPNAGETPAVPNAGETPAVPNAGGAPAVP